MGSLNFGDSLSLDLVPIENKAKKMMTCGRPRSDRVTVRRKILENEMEALGRWGGGWWGSGQISVMGPS